MEDFIFEGVIMFYIYWKIYNYMLGKIIGLG